MSAGDEQSGLREVRFSIYDTSTGADELIRRANQTVERAEAVSAAVSAAVAGQGAVLFASRPVSAVLHI